MTVEETVASEAAKPPAPPKFRCVITTKDVPTEEDPVAYEIGFEVTRDDGTEVGVDQLEDTPALIVFMRAWKAIEALQQEVKARAKGVIVPSNNGVEHSPGYKRLRGRGKGRKR